MAKARRNDKVRLLGVARRPRPALMMSTALQATALLVLAMPTKAQPLPNARPTGGVVAAGSATINQSSNNTRIDQSTQRAAIDWKSFDVGRQQSVTFNQPSVSSVTLNRVTGPDPSHIAGRIDANGQIVLVNQSGVTFYKGAQINAAGVMVSSANISNANFMAGVMNFDQAGSANAKIDNQGSITIKEAGLAALVAPQVANSGRITAKLGHVVLAGAETATLDLYGDGLLSVNVTRQVTQAPIGKDGKTATALVTNTGVIIADGGTVELTARAADGIVQNLVQAGGTIRAATLGDKTGTIALNGVGGSITIEGQLSAPGIAPGTKGGTVQVAADGNVLVNPTARLNVSGKAGGGTVGLNSSGGNVVVAGKVTAVGAKGGAVEVVAKGNVVVAPTARIDASGKSAGGTVAIGTTLNRAKDVKATPTRTAANTVIQKGAVIRADATVNGDGGRVVVLSDNLTSMAGAITARGGAQGGNGGFIEVSGHGSYALSGAMDTGAPAGNSGTILLDPTDLTIINAASLGGDQDATLIGNGGTILFADPNTAKNQISNGVLASLSGTILLEADNTIAVAGGTPITLKKDAGLILQTGTGDITVSAGSPITASGKGFIILDASLIAGKGGKVVLKSGLTADAATGVVRLQGDGGIDLGAQKLSAAVIDLSNISSGSISQTAGGILNGASLVSSAGVVGNVALTLGSNTIGTLGSINVTGALAFTNSTALTVVGPVVATGDVSVTTTGTGSNLTLTGDVTATGKTVTLTSSGNIAQTSGTITAATLQGSAVGGAQLNSGGGVGAGNSVGAFGAFTNTKAGNLIFSNTKAVAVGGLSSAGNISVTTIGSGSDLTLTSDLTATSNTVTLTSAGKIVQTSGTITAATLQGSSVGGAQLNSGGGAGAGNSVDTFSAFTNATSGNLVYTNAKAVSVSGLNSAGDTTVNTVGAGSDLKLTGDLAGGTVSLTATGAISQPGGKIVATNLDATTRNNAGSPISLTSATNAVSSQVQLRVASSASNNQPAGATGNVDFVNIGGFKLVGAVQSSLGGSIALTSGGAITQDAASSLLTSLLTGSSASFDATTGTLNNVGTIGSFKATAGDFGLTNAAALTVAGLLTADNVNLTTTGGAAVNVTGSVTGATSVTLKGGSIGLATAADVEAPTITLNGATGITMNGNAVLGVAGAVVDLNTSGGDVTEATTATIIAATLQSSSGVAGNVDLPGAANAINKLGAFTTTKGFALRDSVPLDIVGAVTTGAGQTIALRTDNLTIGAAVSAPGGTVAIAPATTTRGMSLDAANNPTTLSLLQGDLNNVSAGTLALGSVDGGATLLTNALAINAPINLTGIASTLGLFAAGPIIEPGGLTVAALTGRATGAVTLAGINNIGAAAFNAVGQNFTLLDAGSALLTVNALSAATVDLTAPVISVAGAVTGTTSVSLSATGGGISETGSITTPLLTGNATGAVALTGTNNIAALGASAAVPFSAVGQSFKLLDAGAASLAVNGVTADTVGLTAPSISIPGAITGTTSVNLVATTGGISEAGSVTTPLLTGSAAGAVVLTGTNNIAALGTSAASRFNATGQSFTLIDGSAASLAVNGVTAATVDLTAPVISIPGAITGTTSVNLAASAGGITEAGSVTTPLLTGGATGAVALTGTNDIAALGASAASPFSVPGQSFTLLDAGTASLAVNGISAALIDLTAPAITIPGAITGTTSVSLVATSGGITEAGSITTALLTGSVTTKASFLGTKATTNKIANVGPFKTGTGFEIRDGVALGVVGAITAGAGQTITILTDDFSGITAPLSAPGGTVAIAPATSTRGMSFDTVRSAATLSLLQSDVNNISTGTLALGSLDGGTTLITTSLAINAPINLTGTAGTLGLFIGGPITETGGLTVNTLIGRATGPVNLSGSNNIAVLATSAAAPFDATGQSFTLADNGAALLTVNGVVGTAVSLTAPVITIAGAINGTTSVNLAATAGGITEAGSITSPLLTGGATGTVDLTGANNIAALGASAASPFSAVGQNFTLLDAGSASLAVNGVSAATISLIAPVITIPGAITGTTSVALTATAGGITETGSVATPVLTGSATGNVVLTGSNNIAALGTSAASPFSAVGKAFTLLDAGAASLAVKGVTAATVDLSAPGITIPGAITGTTSVNLVATAGGGIGETGSVTTPLLTGSSAGPVALTGSNNITALGASSAAPFSAVGQSFTLIDAGAALLTVNGITAAAVDLTAPVISIPGAVAGTTSTNLVATAGGITEAGSITTALLTGSATGAVLLTGTNAIAALGASAASPFSAAGQSFTLLDASAPLLTVNGVSAATVGLTAPSITIPGAITGTTSVNLVATTGGIAETGSVTTPLLTGSSAGTVDLIGANNIDALGASAAAPFSAIGQSFALIDSSAVLLTVNGVSAAVISLTAPTISIPGAIIGTTSVDLVASGGGITESGSITTPLLTGLASGAVVLTGTNNIAALGTSPASPFSAAGQSFTLVDAGTATLAVNGLTAATIDLTAPAIAIPGAITGTTSVNLVATTGGIGETGSVTTPLLTGSSAGAVTLTGSNAIDALGASKASPFNATGQSFTLLDAGAALLTVNGVGAATVDLTAPAISIPGAITGTTSVNLVATTGGIGETGSVTTPLLTGSSAGAVALTGSNNIAALGASAASPFSAAGQSFTLLDAGAASLTVNGVTAAAVDLTAPSIAIPGAITGTTSVNLIATVGGIGETGSVTTPQLTGSSAGAVTLTGSNTIAALGASPASPFNAVGQSFTLLDAGTALLTVNGLTAATISLTAPAIDIPGTITGTTSVNLVAQTGGISETGSVITPLLTGSSAGTVDLLGSNNIAALGASAASPFSAVGQSFTLLDPAAALLTVNGVTAATVDLSAPSLSIPGAIAGTTSVNLVATSGGISETGSVTTPLLTGGSAGTVTLTGSNNIAALGANAASPFSAAGQKFTLLDAGAPVLAVNGVTAASVDLTAPTISIPGDITGTTSVRLVATKGGISETGSVTTPLLTGSSAGTVDLLGSNNIAAVGASTASPFSAVGQSFNLLDGGAPLLTVNGVSASAISLTAPSISIPGAITGTTSVNLVATSGGISETGVIATPLLTGSSAGAVALNGANKIAALGANAAAPFSAIGQSFSLADPNSPLLTANGISAATISLFAPSIAIPGTATGTSSVNLVATTGGITETGRVVTPQLGGSAAGAVVLTGANTIATLGPFSATGQSFTLLDAGAALLTVNALNAGVVSLTAPVINIPGTLAGATSVNLVATAGGISESGSVTTPLLTGSAAGTVDLLGGNGIAALGPFNASGQSFTLLDGGAVLLTVNDLLAATVSLSAPSISIPGALTGTTKVTLTATAGDINEPGVVTTPLLTGSAAGDAKFTGPANQVAQLDTFTAANFSLSDATTLTQTGNLTATSATGTVRLTSTAGGSITLDGTTQAQTIVVDAGSGHILLADKAAIITGGTTRPISLPSAASLPGATPATEVDGAFLTTSAGFKQTGSSTVSAIGSGTSVLRINATGSADIAFDPLAGLQGKASTWLILSIDTGTASGQVNVQNLDVVRGGGLTGSTDLTGTIGGVAGSAAAGSAGIQPGPNSNFRFNTCPIRSVNCVLLPTQGIPVANPLNDIYFGTLFNPDDDDDLLLPIVSDRDY